MRYVIILFIFLFLLIPLISAETTFFDQDNAFIMSNSTIGGVTGGTTVVTGETGGGGCIYKWNCTNWSECFVSGKQTRNCINIGTCSNTYKAPEIKQNCTYTVPEIGKEKETGKIIWKEIVNNNKILIYLIIIFIISLIILFVIFYMQKDFLRKRFKKESKS